MSRVLTPAEFVRTFQASEDLSFGARLAEFLKAAADKCPQRFFDRTVVAKIAFNLSRTPAADHEYVKKRLPNIISTASGILERNYGKEIVIDKIDGIRATVDDIDLFKTKHRRKRNRVKSAVASLQATDMRIKKPASLPQALRDELNQSRNSIRMLERATSSLPQLPASSEDETD